MSSQTSLGLHIMHTFTKHDLCSTQSETMLTILHVFFQGGPGCSSMIGLFQENGPCTISADGKTSLLNPHSWNEYAVSFSNNL